jgi:hypothetical protein
MNVEPPETLVIIESMVYKSNGFAIAHRLFKSVEELSELLHRLLNEGEMVIKWDRNIKNKGNAILSGLAA